MQLLKNLITLSSVVLLQFVVAGCDDGGSGDDGGGAPGTDGSVSSGGTTSGSGGTTSGSGGDSGTKLDSILEIAAGNEDFSTLVAAVEKADLADALAGDDLTVFAPTNEAFAALLDALDFDSLDDLSAEQLKPILLYHVVGGVVDSKAALELADDPGSFSSLGGKVLISLEGDDLTLDGNAVVTTPDIKASNGIIHVIDAVILPSITDIVTTSAELEQLKTLVLAADGASGTDPKVATALDGGSFTLFAPNNKAIEDLSVTAPTGQGLTDVLLYHAVAGDPVFAAAALTLNDAAVATVNGADITVDGNGGDGPVSIAEGDGGAAEVVTADILAENGVIHIINKVLLPAP